MKLEEIGAKLNALDAWETALACHWAVKPHGSAIPYFCCTQKGDGLLVKIRLLLLEGWQTFHDFLRLRIDSDFSFYQLPIEMPHYELIILNSGDIKLFRYDTGYAPREAKPAEEKFCTKMLWESYGILMRLETDHQLPLMYADEKAVFARVENADGKWKDSPLEIPSPRPHVEQVRIPKKLLEQAKDLPIVGKRALEVDLRIVPCLMTREARPRILYALVGVDAETGETAFLDDLTVNPEDGLRTLWESMPLRVLKHFIEQKAVPGEIHVGTGRAFRLLRSLCLELPFKLVRVPLLPHVNETLVHLQHGAPNML